MFIYYLNYFIFSLNIFNQVSATYPNIEYFAQPKENYNCSSHEEIKVGSIIEGTGHICISGGGHGIFPHVFVDRFELLTNFLRKCSSLWKQSILEN